MKLFSHLFVFFCVSIFTLCALANSEAEKNEVLVSAEDIPIQNDALKRSLLKVVKDNGTLTSTRQVDSYMLAILCEYPPKDMKSKPDCTFRKVKVRPLK